MSVAARRRSTTASTLAVAFCVLLGGCARDGVAAEGASPSAVASHGATCSPTPVTTPSEERTPGGLSGEQEPLMSDSDVVLQYGVEHPDEFAGVTFANEPWVRIVAAFTGHLDQHCAALRRLVEHPERLEVVRRRHPAEKLKRIRAEIQPLLTADGQIEGLGLGWDHVSVELRADGEALAAELWARYGDALQMRVGSAPYPPSDAPSAAFACDIGQIDAWPEGVSAALALENDVVTAGRHGRGTVTIVNESAERFRADLGQPEIGWVFEPGGTTPVGIFTGVVGGEGVTVDLAAGERRSLRMVFGTAACDPAQGYALPPGTYDVRAVLPAAFEETPEGEMVPGPVWLSDAAWLRIVEGSEG